MKNIFLIIIFVSINQVFILNDNSRIEKHKRILFKGEEKAVVNQERVDILIEKRIECLDYLGTSCPICLEDYKNETAIIVLNCLHSIGKECWDSFIKNGDFVCPKCRFEIFTFLAELPYKEILELRNGKENDFSYEQMVILNRIPNLSYEMESEKRIYLLIQKLSEYEKFLIDGIFSYIERQKKHDKVELWFHKNNITSEMLRIILLKIECCNLSKRVIRLNLSNNRLTFIPEEIEKLSSLKNLNLSKNELMVIPNEIAKLESLEYLNLSYNQLGIFPEEINFFSKFKNLLFQIKERFFSYNRVTIFPKEIEKLYRLKRLNLLGNKLNDKEKDELTRILVTERSDENKVQLVFW